MPPPGRRALPFFGAAILSFSAGVTTQPGDEFEISAPGFGRPLRNAVVKKEKKETLVTVNKA